MAIQEQFPHLFKPNQWSDQGISQFEIREDLPDESHISNVNLIPYMDDRWGIIQVFGMWDIPGGTLEPGERYIDAVHREAMEEMGAEVVSLQPLGAIRYHSTAPKPYRPHLPHPRFYRYILLGEVRIVGPPTNPPGGEYVTAVAFASLDEVVRRFLEIDRPEFAESYQLAAAVRRSRQS